MAAKTTEAVTLSAATSTTSFTDSVRSTSTSNSTSTSSKPRGPAMSVMRSLAKHSVSIGRHLVKVPSKSAAKISGDRPPNMAKMRQVTPVYDHELKRWVFPNPVLPHRDEPPCMGSACKQLPGSSTRVNRQSSGGRS